MSIDVTHEYFKGEPDMCTGRGRCLNAWVGEDEVRPLSRGCAVTDLNGMDTGFVVKVSGYVDEWSARIVFCGFCAP